MQSEILIQKLVEQTRLVMNQVERLKGYDPSALSWRADASSWSMLECLEHLNLYGDFYLPEIEKKINHSKTTSEETFKSGWLGKYFADSMLPKDKLNKMKTFKDKNPIHVELDKKVIERFINQQMQLLDLLNKARSISLNKVKISTSISSLIKLKLGDTFQFFINHILRHMKQIEKIEEVRKLTAKH